MNWVTSDFLRSHLLLTLVLEVQRWKLFASSLQESLSKTWGRKNRIRTPYEKADLFSTITIYESLLILPSLGILNVQQKLSEAPNSKSPKVPKRILYSLHCWRWSVSLQLKKKKKDDWWLLTILQPHYDKLSLQTLSRVQASNLNQNMSTDIPLLSIFPPERVKRSRHLSPAA